MSVNTGYTNGLNVTRVMTALVGRLGWRASTQAGQPVLSAENTTSNSGRYFNDFHALVSVPNIKATQDNPLISDNEFNTYLQNLQKGAIIRCLNGVLPVPEMFERVLLFNRRGQSDAVIENTGKFCGFEILVPKNDTVSVQLENATLLFDSDVTFNLYLFIDGKDTALKTKSVSATAGEMVVVSFDDWVLSHLADATKGSRFYVGYFQDDLGGAKAIREQYECWNPQKCFSARSMTADATGATTFNRDERSTTLDTYGINLQVSSFRDHTSAVCSKAALFDEVVGLQMAYTVLEQIMYAVRSNETERILKDQILKAGLQLEMLGAIAAPDSPQITGLKSRIDRELKRVKDGFYPSPKAQTVSLC